MPGEDLTFELYNLRVEISKRSGPIVGKHRVGDYFEVVGEDLFLPPGQGFSLYALAALQPLLPAKQRSAHANDWMSSDEEVADPDPNCKAVYRITRTGKTAFRRDEVTATAPPNNGAAG
jgi:uncharacterized repeat protein (TIGR04076 family)